MIPQSSVRSIARTMAAHEGYRRGSVRRKNGLIAQVARLPVVWLLLGKGGHPKPRPKRKHRGT